MSQTLKDNIHYLMLLGSSDVPRQQKQGLLNTVTKRELNSLSEVALNILQGSLDIGSSHKITLKRHLNNIRVLASKKATRAERKTSLSVPLVEALLLTAHPFLNGLTYGGR